MKTIILVLGAASMVSGGTAAQQIDIGDFVRQVFIHGLPYEEASRYDSSVVPTLLEMLDDPAEETHWTNVVGMLGIIGTDRAVGRLIEFADEDVRGTLSRAHYVAKSSVPIALGYSVNRTGSEEALNYLSESLDPNIWNTRGLTWTSPYHAAAADRNVQLSTMAIMGLGLSGHPAAADALRTLQTPDTTRARFQAQVNTVITEALEALQTVAEVGLAEYYRRIGRSN